MLERLPELGPMESARLKKGWTTESLRDLMDGWRLGDKGAVGQQENEETQRTVVPCGALE